VSAPRFSVGDILRYGEGSTALLRVAYISPKHGDQPRYYGQQCMGGSCAAYEGQCNKATPPDVKTWHEVRREYPKITPWYKFRRDRGLVGQVED